MHRRVIGWVCAAAALVALANPVSAGNAHQWHLAAYSPPSTGVLGGVSSGMVYDTARRQTVLIATNSQFGGAAVATFNGKRWTRREHWEGDQSGYPPSRSGAAVAYDPATKQTIVFGGTGSAHYGDTWAWDGRKLKQVATTGPEPRSGAQLVYDPKIRRLVLFGGYLDIPNQWVFYTDTWTWDGKAWQRLAGTSPPGRIAASVVYDEARRELVMTGGVRMDADPSSGWKTTVFGDAWTFDGKAWHQTQSQLPGREHGAMVYDEHSKEVVLFGGDSDPYRPMYLADTWTWDGHTWTQRQSGIGEGQGPGPRAYASFAYDRAKKEAVLFGGRNSSYLGDTWGWDGSDWIRESPGGRPQDPRARVRAPMVYDEARKQIMMFGGYGSQDFGGEDFADTWLWRDYRWVDRTGTGVYDQAMAYDAAHKQTVLFGGFNGAKAFYDGNPGPASTLTWDGRSWTARPAPHQPTGRQGTSMVYDAALRSVLLFGGHYSGAAASARNVVFNDTWLWTGRKWRTPRVQNDRAPSPRWGANLVYDAARRQVLLFGGYTVGAAGYQHLNDTWTFDAHGWKQRDPGGVTGSGPPAREKPAIAYDAASKQVVLFGGQSTTATDANSLGGLADVTMNDTWIWNGNSWKQAPLTTAISSPSPRNGAAMVYDAARKSLVLFGGNSYSSLGTGCTACDTWGWDGRKWSKLSTESPFTPWSPPVSQWPSYAKSWAYDAATRQVVAVTPPYNVSCGTPPMPGCGETPAITWTWNGKVWNKQKSPMLDSNDVGAPLVYDEARKRLVMVGIRHTTWTW